MERENYQVVSPHVLKRFLGHRVDVIERACGYVYRSGRIAEAKHHPVADFWEFAWTGHGEWQLKLHGREVENFEFRLFEASTGMLSNSASGYCVEVRVDSIKNGDYIVFKNDDGDLWYGEVAEMVAETNGILSAKVDGVETGFASDFKVLKVMR